MILYMIEAAEQGDISAQVGMRLRYYHGDGVKKDDSKAVGWYLTAASHGDAIAQYNVGNMYEEGSGVPQNYSKAWEWYHLSAHQNSQDALSRLCQLYISNKHDPKDQSDFLVNIDNVANQVGNKIKECGSFWWRI